MLSTSISAGMCVLVCSHDGLREMATPLLAELALRGKVLVIDGGNRLQAYPLARALRERTTRLDLLSQRLLIRRAFTAYQMLTLLENTSALSSPLVILDLLVTFYDETLAAGPARWLIQRCLQEIDRLQNHAPVFILLISSPTSQRRFLQEMVCKKADMLFIEPRTSSFFVQPSLFKG